MKKEIEKRNSNTVQHSSSYKRKNEKGSITIFVVIAIVFFIILLITMFVMMKNRETAMSKEIDQIKTNYGAKVDPDEVYTSLADKDDKYVTQGMIEDLVNKVVNDKLLTIYPVGSIYISETNRNPGEFLGGTWQSYGHGRTLVGAGTSDKTFNAGTTGGESTHRLTTYEMPSHSHSFSGSSGYAGTHSHSFSGSTVSAGSHSHSFSGSTGSAGSHTHGTESSEFPSFNIMNTAKMTRHRVGGGSGDGFQWTTDNRANYGYQGVLGSGQKTGSAGSHSHSLSGSIGSSGSHSHSLSGTIGSDGYHYHSVSGTVGSEGSGTAHNNLQPYIVTYMWKRVS